MPLPPAVFSQALNMWLSAVERCCWGGVAGEKQEGGWQEFVLYFSSFFIVTVERSRREWGLHVLAKSLRMPF